ncbi:MAG: hypothetical protein A2Z78_01290 [Candidatus Nealsonbacteria bacterium RBG_13_36_15]|uniref:Methyltransferase type 11 domain-containing protein n=1 Tax=Candidatus Nealsonbacteria bacterium RBG_13_36_15 TaxID=1801660 RepID=A0A1G2DV24_9BACT|nr:MAG: hypothetical protein A2Z78_01290 [Candidatus Nealsonbacteria bacterium RBG_13_36_15]
MSEELVIKNKYYRWSPIRFLVEKIIKDMNKRTVDFLEVFVQEGEKIIDIGGGGGWISQELQKRKNTKNTLLDVIDLNQTDLPLIIYDGENMPFEDNAFDTALLICVLHHCQNPDEVLKEAKRIVRNKIIIIENISTSRFDRITLCIKDAITNIIFCFLVNSLKKITNLPFHFKTVSEWEEIFDKLDLKVVYKKDPLPSVKSVHGIAFIVQKN